jgi:hypothetical protein
MLKTGNTISLNFATSANVSLKFAKNSEMLIFPDNFREKDENFRTMIMWEH